MCLNNSWNNNKIGVFFLSFLKKSLHKKVFYGLLSNYQEKKIERHFFYFSKLEIFVYDFKKSYKQLHHFKSLEIFVYVEGQLQSLDTRIYILK